MKIFVSYTTKDKEISKSFLKQVLVALEQFGEVYIDMLSNDSIDKQLRVLEELERSDIIILIVSKNVYNSIWVKRELEIASKLEKIIIKLLPSDFLGHRKGENIDLGVAPLVRACRSLV